MTLPPDAELQCMRCSTRFRDRPRASADVAGAYMGDTWQAKCPLCNSLYVMLTGPYPPKPKEK